MILVITHQSGAWMGRIGRIPLTKGIKNQLNLKNEFNK